MKTSTNYIIETENKFDFENKALVEDSNDVDHKMTFSYIFTMNGDELMQQKVFNYEPKRLNDGNMENVMFLNDNVNNFTPYQSQSRDRLSSAASTVDDTGSDDFVINQDGDNCYERYSFNSESDEQDAYVLDQIFPQIHDYDTCYNKSRSVNDSEVNTRNQHGNHSMNGYSTNNSLLKIYDKSEQDQTESIVHETVLPLFHSTHIDEDKNSYTKLSNSFLVQDVNEDSDCYKWHSLNETSSNSTIKQTTTSNDVVVIDCDESVSSLTLSSCEESTQLAYQTQTGFIDGFKGFNSCEGKFGAKWITSSDSNVQSPSEENSNQQHNALPPIETVLQGAGRLHSSASNTFNSMIRKHSSRLNCTTKTRDNKSGEFGHLNCGHWQKSSVNDINCNIPNNQIVISQSEGGSIDVHTKVKEETSTGLLECRWEDCWALFQGQSALVRHIEKTHVELRRGEEFACMWQACPRRTRPFNARYKLLIHMRVHSGEKPNKCPFQGCLKAFSRLENLKIHQRSHTGERPYACQFQGCPKAFSNSSDRAKHQRTHFDTKPYACQVPGCNKRYTDPSSLRKHIKNHGGLSTSRTKKLVASEPIVSTNELKTRHKFDSTSPISSPVNADEEDLQLLDTTSDDINDVSADLSDSMTEFIPYESIQHLLGEGCMDAGNWEVEMSAEIEQEFLNLTSDYTSTLMDMSDSDSTVDRR